MATNPDDPSEDEEWRFSLEDIEQRNADGAGGGDDGDEDGGGNVAGAFSPDEEIEAGDIDPENALFVLVGVALAVLVLAGFANVLP
jgi:preprotein translocase subunit Sec61beta